MAPTELESRFLDIEDENLGVERGEQLHEHLANAVATARDYH